LNYKELEKCQPKICFAFTGLAIILSSDSVMWLCHVIISLDR